MELVARSRLERDIEVRNLQCKQHSCIRSARGLRESSLRGRCYSMSLVTLQSTIGQQEGRECSATTKRPRRY